ncbi:AI-2E family transporter [Candidatus Collinsella stercoripullorum]|uniref:AI-2E family transporter n=1 Tax=Candidatus Collinsella stercoripullorum TaxID=2838522 RepID=UPI0022E5065C|nr:AI-2E family transporter [Candidatus Collinsella stercoripullorum]
MTNAEHGAAGADRALRDTRLIALRIWAVVGALVIGAMLLNVVGVLAPVVLFLAVGSLIAFVEAPVVNGLEHRGVPRGVGALVGLIVVIAAVVLLFTMLLPMLISQVIDVLNEMPRYFVSLQAWISRLVGDFRALTSSDMFSGLTDVLDSLQRTATGFVTDLAADLGRGVMPLIGGFANTLFIVFLGLVLAYWLARDYPKIHGEVGCALGEGKEEDYRFLLAILSRSVGGYMRSMIVTSVVNGVMVFIGLVLVGHPYAGLMGVLTGIFHLIPVVGPWISAAASVFVAFFHGPATALWTLAVCVVAQNITDNVISPKVMQSSVQVHPAMSLAAIVIGSALMGPLGMVVAIPLTAALKGLFIFYFEKRTGRQLVDYDGAIFRGTPYRDEYGDPVPAFDALGDDSFVADSELLTDDLVPEATALPKPEFENPWSKLAGLQPGSTGMFRNPFAGGDDSGDDKEDDGR